MKPLEGIKVVELSTFVAGPSCARMLADWGAEVIKVESPQGDQFRTMGNNYRVPITDVRNPIFDNENANKSFIVLNLKEEKGLEAMLKLLETADVFITNTRPKALRKLGLDYEQINDRCPRLVYGIVLGYGEEGPERDRPAFDYTTFYAR
ncbi:MAG: CoA transferase, partial [Oscillospiraceae bacterium]